MEGGIGRGEEETRERGKREGGVGSGIGEGMRKEREGEREGEEERGGDDTYMEGSSVGIVETVLLGRCVQAANTNFLTSRWTIWHREYLINSGWSWHS